MADDSTETDAAAEEARAKAEARRQRILEQSRERLGVVAGDLPTGDSAENENEQDGATAETTPSGESRMQAMRRRRFKKTTQTKESDETKEEKTTASKPTETAETTEETTLSKAAPVDTVDDTKTPVSQETKKKYKGVAKMRREMIKKKEAESEAGETKTDEPGTVTSIPLMRKAPVSPIPIIVHLVAVLLLFFAGVDIGWNQAAFSDVSIYRDLTPRQEGIGLVKRFMTPFSTKTILLDPSKLQDTEEWSSQEEFATSKEEEEDYVPNIDPVFRVDFDKLTEGGGLFNTIAKGAISIHRLILNIFYFLPLSILQTIATIPRQLLVTPPILCIISLIIRQTAKLVFGKLPDPASDKKDSKDVLAMMKQGVINFLAGMFPTAVNLYDVWSHLRSDMYVILCGVFVGLAYTHSMVEPVESDEEIIAASTDEL